MNYDDMEVTRLDRGSRGWDAHRERWERCALCPLHETTTNHTLARWSDGDPGQRDWFFLGEAPGWVDDCYGSAFTPLGYSGIILDNLLCDAQITSFVLTYTIACFPRAGSCGPFEYRQPVPDEIASCNARVADLMDFTEPKAVVTLGGIARKHLPKTHLPTLHLSVALSDRYWRRPNSEVIRTMLDQLISFKGKIDEQN